jgi:hypothetical protein
MENHILMDSLRDLIPVYEVLLVYHHLFQPRKLLELALAVVRHVTWLRLEVVNCGELVDDGGFFAEEDIDKQLNVPVR